MIAMRMISSTPQQKAFIIPVDLVLHFRELSSKSTVNTEWLSIAISTNSTICSLLCCVLNGEEKAYLFWEKNRSKPQSLQLRTIKVAAVQDIPNCYSKMPLIALSCKETCRVERLFEISLANSQPLTCTPGTLKAAGTLLLTRRFQGFASKSAVPIKVTLQWRRTLKNKLNSPLATGWG